MDDYIQREMYRVVREYEYFIKEQLAAFLAFPSMSSPPSNPSPMPPSPEPVDPPLPPTLSIALYLGWNNAHVGFIPPNKTSVELLFPPIPCLIGLNEDESEVLYGNQIYEAGRKTLPSAEKTRRGTQTMGSCFHIGAMLRDKEVEWRKGKWRVKSELPLAMFLIHVKTKIEVAILPSSAKYKVIMVLPQALSIVQRGRISDATKLAGLGEEVHLIKESTAVALAVAHDAAVWSPGSTLPILVSCPPDVLDSNVNENNADVAIFKEYKGILSMEKLLGARGLD
jgi:hypothetical protein